MRRNDSALESRGTLVVATETFSPDQSGTANLLGELVTELSSRHPVAVFTASPGPSRVSGAAVVRVGYAPHARVPLVIRAVRVAASSFAIAWRSATYRGARVHVAVVGPTFIPPLLSLLLPTRARLALVVHDVYPDAAIASGAMKARGIVARLWKLLSAFSYRRADVVVAIGHDMQSRLHERFSEVLGKVSVIPHWRPNRDSTPLSKVESSTRKELAAGSNFVVLCAGNLGATHGIDCLLGAAKKLRGRFHREQLCFLFLGDGARREAVVAASLDSGSLVVYGGRRDRAEEADFLAAADICYVGYSEGMSGVSVPSRVATILGAARPVLAVADSTTDLAEDVRVHRIGWRVAPGDVDGLAEVIGDLVDNPEECVDRGLNARRKFLSMRKVSEAAVEYENVLLGYSEIEG